MKNRIYFFANFGEWDKHPYGGGEIGNRRTLELLKRMDFDLVVIEKYNRVSRNSIRNKIRFFARVVGNVLKYMFILIFGRRKCSLLHVVGFYGVMIDFDHLMVSIGKVLGYRVIYEMRGGGAELFYWTMGKRYRQKFDRLIRKSDFIFSQGTENEPLIHEIDVSKHIFYYPNYVMDDFYPTEYPEKPTDKINLIYFGRISPSKNVDVVVSVFTAIRKKYDNVYLDIVGNYEDKAYFRKIADMIHTVGAGDHVQIHPACDHERLKEHLRNKHFYIFPTDEPREGHSNAMTEAMAWGLIPISADHGFNRSVLANDELIADCPDPICFAERVEQIVEKGRIKEISHLMYERVGKLYTEEQAFLRLKDEYSRLFESIL